MQGRVYLGRRTRHGILATVLTLSLLALAQPAPALAEDLDLDPSFASDPIPEIWAQADGDDARSGPNQSWIWGPAIHAATHEPYADSPDGVREVYYFDKARMEINDPAESRDSIWYATSGLLIREMMLGQIQIGDQQSVETEPAEIPVTGDLEDNGSSPTYATLAAHTTLGGRDDNRAGDRGGEQVTTFLHADGSLDDGFDPPAESSIAYYDDTLGHNVPDVFWDWMTSQAIGWEYIFGHPVTEPYWVDTLIEGEPQEVMVQAFERRVLTFNPANDSEWQVEAGNAGLHYRAWRDLSMPDDETLHSLAHGIPYGEIVVDAAVRNGVDAFVLAGVADAASGFDPAASLTEDRSGLMGLPTQLAEQRGVPYPLDPAYNSRVAGDLLAMLQNESGSWETAVRQYFGWQDAIGTFADPPEEVADTAIAATQEYRDRFGGEPSPFDFEPEEIDPPDTSSEEESEIESEVDEDGLRFVGSGEAAHYGEEAYPIERMEEILAFHASYGNAIPDWEYDPNGFYCVHPEFLPGERLHLTAPSGEEFWCTIADTVALHHRAQWRSSWGIEVNWELFEAMGVPYQETIEVRAPAE